MTSVFGNSVSIPVSMSTTRRPSAFFRWLRRAGEPTLQQAFEVVEYEGSIAMRSFREWVDVPIVEEDAGNDPASCNHVFVHVPLDPANPSGPGKGRCRECGFEPTAGRTTGGAT